MVRQYRIERFNGLEVLVCEIYLRHTWNNQENDAYAKFMAAPGDIHIGISRSEFRVLLDDWLKEDHLPQDTFYGLSDPIPSYDYLPHIVLRGVIVDNRIASLQVDYDRATLSPEVVDAVHKFYGVLDSRHWRDMVSHQIESYGSLFASADD